MMLMTNERQTVSTCQLASQSGVARDMYTYVEACGRAGRRAARDVYVRVYRDEYAAVGGERLRTVGSGHRQAGSGRACTVAPSPGSLE